VRVHLPFIGQGSLGPHRPVYLAWRLQFSRLNFVSMTVNPASMRFLGTAHLPSQPTALQRRDRFVRIGLMRAFSKTVLIASRHRG